MIVALAQTSFHPGLRSRNLTLLTRAVIKTAKLTPAPDLILLPDGAGLSIQTEEGPLLSPAMCQGLTESLAWLAREWGVWIAVAHAQPSGDGVAEAISLFDPDGDPYVRHIRSDSDSLAWTTRLTPLGRVGVGFADSEAVAEPEGSADEDSALDLLILAAPNGCAVPAAEEAAAMAAQQGCYVSLLGHTDSRSGSGDSTQEGSVIVAPGGDVIAQTCPQSPSITSSTLAIDPPSSEQLGEWEAAIDGG